MKGRYVFFCLSSMFVCGQGDASAATFFRWNVFCCRYRQFQVSNDGRLAELQAQLQMRSYECERSRLVQQELNHQLKSCHQERDKLTKKIEVGNTVP